MIPAARVQAAAVILDAILAGEPAEKALTGWARRSRYAGSKDRAAVRDHVFDAIRCRRSLAALGGAETGRGLMLGACRRDGVDPETVFTGQGHAPPALTDQERTRGRAPSAAAERLDLPDWLWPLFRDSLGDGAEAAARSLQSRAPVHLRVNLRKANRDGATDLLASEGIVCVPHPASETALVVIEGSRRIRQSTAYGSGVVELQDAASQAVTDLLPLRDGLRILDYCAGGGGKTLAMGARADVTLFAHDAAPQRLRDLPARARRAGISVKITDNPAADAPYDLVFCDVPCSGSGAWRRAPEGKWRLTPDRLAEVQQSQAEILEQAAQLVAAKGVLAYATCSVLNQENRDQIDRFLKNHENWSLVREKAWRPDNGSDGFFASILTRETRDI